MRAVVLLAIVICSATLSAQTYSEELDRSNFERADSIANLYPKYSLRDMRGLVDKLTKSLPTDDEKFRAIYRWITYNIENDYGLYIKNKNKREKLKDAGALNAWNKEFSKVVFKELVDQQKTVCSGYAYLLKEMASMAGVNCVIIDGYGRTSQANIGGPGIANHSWNAVKLHDKWYLCDVTWSSGATDTGSRKYIKRFDTAYFLADPALFVRNHYPLDSAWMLLNHKPTLHEFLNRPIIYSGIYTYEIDCVTPETFNVTVLERNPVNFCFKKNDKVVDKLELRINGVIPTYLIENPPINKSPEGLYCINHVFRDKGEFVLHVLINNSYVLSYTVNVQ